MKRSLCVFVMGLALSTSLWAADAPKKGKATTTPAPSAPRAISGRAQLEALLQSPAKLDFDGRHRITVREIIDKLHEQHRLSLRFDSPTLAALLEKSQSSSSYHSGQVASGLGSLPLGLIATYSSVPVCCSPAGAYPSAAPVCSAPACVGPACAPAYAAPAVTFPNPSYLKAPVAQVSAYEASPGNAEDAAPKAPPVPVSAAPASIPAPATAATAVAPALPLAPANAAVSPAPLAPALPQVVQGQPVYPGAAAAPAPPAAPTAPDQLREAMIQARTESRTKRVKPSPEQLSEKMQQAAEPLEDKPAALPAAPAHVAPGTVPPFAPGTAVPSAVEPTPPPAAAGSAQSSTSELLQTVDELLETEVDVQTLDLSSVSIATILRHALDAVPTTNGDDFAGMPILVTNASLLDYLVEDDGLLITSRMKALSKRETRVYSLKQLSGIPPEQLAKTIRQSIRPWSWRSQINDLGDQLKGTPLPAETMTSLLKSGVQLISAEAGIEVTPSEEPESKPANAADVNKQMEMVGGAISNGLVTLAHSTLLVMEMMHYAEPPTATIQTLGNKLIVTQSQAAHREIAELLKQLRDE